MGNCIKNRAAAPPANTQPMMIGDNMVDGRVASHPGKFFSRVRSQNEPNPAQFIPLPTITVQAPNGVVKPASALGSQFKNVTTSKIGAPVNTSVIVSSQTSSLIGPAINANGGYPILSSSLSGVRPK